MNEWMPWIGTWVGIVIKGVVLCGYLIGEKKGWWW